MRRMRNGDREDAENPSSSPPVPSSVHHLGMWVDQPTTLSIDWRTPTQQKHQHRGGGIRREALTMLHQFSRMNKNLCGKEATMRFSTTSTESDLLILAPSSSSQIYTLYCYRLQTIRRRRRRRRLTECCSIGNHSIQFRVSPRDQILTTSKSLWNGVWCRRIRPRNQV